MAFDFVQSAAYEVELLFRPIVIGRHAEFRLRKGKYANEAGVF